MPPKKSTMKGLSSTRAGRPRPNGSPRICVDCGVNFSENEKTQSSSHDSWKASRRPTSKRRMSPGRGRSRSCTPMSRRVRDVRFSGAHKESAAVREASPLRNPKKLTSKRFRSPRRFRSGGNQHTGPVPDARGRGMPEDKPVPENSKQPRRAISKRRTSAKRARSRSCSPTSGRVNNIQVFTRYYDNPQDNLHLAEALVNGTCSRNHIDLVHKKLCPIPRKSRSGDASPEIAIVEKITMYGASNDGNGTVARGTSMVKKAEKNIPKRAQSSPQSKTGVNELHKRVSEHHLEKPKNAMIKSSNETTQSREKGSAQNEALSCKARWTFMRDYFIKHFGDQSNILNEKWPLCNNGESILRTPVPRKQNSTKTPALLPKSPKDIKSMIDVTPSTLKQSEEVKPTSAKDSNRLVDIKPSVENESSKGAKSSEIESSIEEKPIAPMEYAPSTSWSNSNEQIVKNDDTQLYEINQDPTKGNEKGPVNSIPDQSASEIEHFFKSLIPTISKLDVISKMEFQRDVQNLVIKYTICHKIQSRASETSRHQLVGRDSANELDSFATCN